MLLEIKLAYDKEDKVKELFIEYTNMLIKLDKKFAYCLELQGYDYELKDLQVKYGKPYGRLYLATVDGEMAGCIALKKMNDGKSCELKRLYVKPKFRGNHIAEKMVKQIISDAKELGYKYMFLDTLPYLQSAIHIYKKVGFYEIEAYNDNPMEDSIFMKLDLDEK